MLDSDFRNAHGADKGISLDREFRAWSSELQRLTAGLLARRDQPEAMLGWIDLPERTAELEQISSLAAELQSGFTDLVVLGIGGSSLGGLAVTSALQHPYRQLQPAGDGLKVHFVDNVDPDQIRGLLEVLNPARTLVNVISKSGTTAETMAAYLIFRRWLEAELGDAYASQVIATTDPETGILRPLAEQQGYRLLSVPPSVGGRFSVLSAVGLLPVSLAGIDARGLLRGAARANHGMTEPLERNPVLTAALLQYLHYRRGRSISVFMPYSSRLKYLSDWFVQLWAESLGKATDLRGSQVNEGPTPLGALGATDQHSQVQLFNEGPDDKIITFIRVAAADADLSIPAAEPGIPELDYLAGRSLATLLNAEQAATAHALSKHGRPNYTLTLPAVDAESLGELLQFLMWQTAVMGELLKINAFDQPGVELGKQYTYALMGREGFADLRSQLLKEGVELSSDGQPRPDSA